MSSICEEYLNNTHMTTQTCDMQWCVAILIRQVDVCSVFKEELNNIYMRIKKGNKMINKKQGELDEMFISACKGHTDVFRLLLEKGANINTDDKNGTTPLHRACRNCHIDIVQLLCSSRSFAISA
jgi:ankyrin repeat protein